MENQIEFKTGGKQYSFTTSIQVIYPPASIETNMNEEVSSFMKKQQISGVAEDIWLLDFINMKKAYVSCFSEMFTINIFKMM